jgi:membrane protein YqaA with SNARE-associated domain
LDSLAGWFTPDLSLWGLFLSSLLAATLLPGGSELVLAGVLKLHPELFWPALLVGTLGNTLGGMSSFALGWFFPHKRMPAHLDQVRRYGAPTLLLAWAPLVGDALCVAAGWLRIRPWFAALFMAIGKFARYWVIAMALP